MSLAGYYSPIRSRLLNRFALLEKENIKATVVMCSLAQRRV